MKTYENDTPLRCGFLCMYGKTWYFTRILATYVKSVPGRGPILTCESKPSQWCTARRGSHPVDFPLTAPHLTTAHFTTPHNTSLQLTSAHFTSPHITSPHLTTPLRPPSGPVFYGSKLTFLLLHLSSPYPVYASPFSPLLAISATKTRRDPPPDPPKSGPKPLGALDATPPWTASFAQGAQDPLKTR